MDKKTSRLRRARKTRARIKGLRVVRLCVNRTPRHIYAQIISSDGGSVLACASTIDKEFRASGAMGGTVDLLGSRVALNDQAVIDVSGDAGGGTVRLGGDLLGKNADIQNAAFTYTGAQTSIKADALSSGNGGKVIVWADDTTRAYGSISAKGGAQLGDGGFVETSGKRGLDIAGARIDTSAAKGVNGQWLLDPSDVTIVHGSASPLIGGIFDPVDSLSIGDAEINTALVNNNVTIQTSNGTGGTGAIVVNGSADVNGPVNISSSFGGLYLRTSGNVDIRSGANLAVPYALVEGGNITVNGNFRTNTLDLTSRGYLSGTGALVTNTLYTQSVTGTLLNGTANQVLGNWTGYNTGAGNIELASSSGISLGGISNTNGGVTVNSTNGINVTDNINVTGAVTLAAGAGDLNQSSGSGRISNIGTGTSGTPGMSLSGANITLHSVQSAGGVQLTTPGTVNLLGMGSGSYIDDTFFSYNLPFTFNYFGTDYTQAFITTNGLITFGSSTSAYTDSISGLASLRAISPAWNDWILKADQGKDIRIAPSRRSFRVLWNVAICCTNDVTPSYPAAQFESILNSNGVIRFNYGAANQTFAGDVTIGISNGSDINLISALMSEPVFSMNNLRSTTFTPDGRGSYTETLAAGSTPLSAFGSVSGSAILGQGTGEVITAAGALNINAGGAINAGAINASSITLSALAGSITQVGGLTTAGLLTASARDGILLDQAENHVGSFRANTTGAGNIRLTNVGVLDIQSIDASNGDVVVNNTGGIRTSGLVTASNGNIAMTANSPLTIGPAGILAGGNIDLAATNLTSSGDVTLNGPITSTGGSIFMTAANTFTQNSAVSAALGVTATAGAGFTFGPAATTAGNPVSYSSGIVPPTPSPLPTPTPIETQAATPPPVSSSPTDFVVAFLSQLEDALTEQNADTDKTSKKTKDGVVTGAQTYSR